ncbi:hypothetical protein QBC46DRAFT_382603 [Diplogelasinospora grovesii]|uniref:Uncharacterized protein n=1 Tax=Diplogelasinospora grovesii TaxID=303347 RepID=A0AAN6N8Z9_9PEZI|nr:hypothetical protein QBC46DRAFT_382603 [Diplogelasinospora grovesii]
MASSDGSSSAWAEYGYTHDATATHHNSPRSVSPLSFQENDVTDIASSYGLVPHPVQQPQENASKQPSYHVEEWEELRVAEDDQQDARAATETATSNEKTPFPMARMPTARHHHRILRSWRWEFITLLIGLGLVAAMAAILGHFDGQRMPDWGYSINLSTLLAMLATIFRSSLVAVIGQIISQMKWSWFMNNPRQQPQPLRHLQDFDDGSRNALGAALLIPTAIRGASPMAALSALAMVLSLAVGPMVQQAIRTTDCIQPASQGNASIPYAHYVPRTGGYHGQGERSVDVNTQLAAYTSITGPTGPGNQITVSCVTGNCTFPDGDPIVGNDITPSSDANDEEVSHSTIGLCSRCVNTTSLVQASTAGDGFSVFYTLPNGVNITDGPYGVYVNVGTDSNLTWAGHLVTSDLAAASRWAFANVTLLMLTQAGCGQNYTANCTAPAPGNNGSTSTGTTLRSHGVVAATCSIYPCMRSYTTSVANNVLSERPLSSTVAVPAMDNNNNNSAIGEDYVTGYNALGNVLLHYTAIQSPCRVNGTVYVTAQNMSSAHNATSLRLYERNAEGSFEWRNVSAPEQCIYRHNGPFGSALTKLFTQTIFSGSCAVDPHITGPSCGGTADQTGLRMWLMNVQNNNSATTESVSSYLDSFTQAMTNKYRVLFGSATYDGYVDPGPDLVEPGEVQGIVWQTSVCTSVQWRWLMLPGALPIVTMALLAWVVGRSWARRFEEPVWKESVLPATLYRERFMTSDGTVIGPLQYYGAAAPAETQTEGRQNRLMDVEEMTRIASNMHVSFHLPENAETYAGKEEQGGEWPRKRQRRVSLDSLLTVR